MQDSKQGKMGRREFLGAAIVVLAGTTLTLVGCGTEDDDSGGDGSIKATATGSGHTHTGSISKAQLDAGADVSIALTGSGHTHSVALTAAQVATLKTSGMLMGLTSTEAEGHTHTVDFGH